jgi:hypothetical protein
MVVSCEIMNNRLITVLCLAALTGAAAFATDDAAGWVVTKPDDARWNRNGQPLKLYDAIFVNDKLQGASGKIEVALKDGQSPHEYHCDKFPCDFTVGGFRPAQDSLLARLGRAFEELHSHRDTMPVSAISRGSEHLRQAVLMFQDGKLDLKDVVRSVDTAALAVSLRPIQTADSAAQGRVRGSLNWDPPAATFASFPPVAPGIYELTMASSEGDSLGSVAVLVVAPADYAAKRRSFEAGVEALPKGLHPLALDAFLNALLFDAGSSLKVGSTLK